MGSIGAHIDLEFIFVPLGGLQVVAPWIRTHSEANMNPSDCPKQLLANLTQKWFVGWIRKVGCVFSIVDVSIPPHAEFGPNEHREGTPQFMTTHI